MKNIPKFGKRPFVYVGTTAWNIGTTFQSTFVTSPHLRPATFRRHLKKVFIRRGFEQLLELWTTVMSAGHLCKLTQKQRQLL